MDTADDHDLRDDLWPAKEEPDCGLCNDGRGVPAGRLNSLIGRATVSCPSCRPTPITRVYQLVYGFFRWKVPYQYRLYRYSLTGKDSPFDNEAPF